MSQFLGTTSRVREITPPRQYEVLTGRSYLQNLEGGEIRTWTERASFTLDDATGQVSIQSEYGDYAYRWTSIGKATLAEFLCSLDMDYFMNKAAIGAWQEIDFDGTINQLKSQILDYRREQNWDGGSTKEKARAAWDEVESIDHDEIRSVDQFYAEYNQLSDVQDIVSTYDLEICHRIKPTAQHFWDVVMKAFRDHVIKLREIEKSRLDLEAA